MKRRIVATMYRGRQKEVVWVRHYNYMDTAMPRALQLALSTAVEGDAVEFASTEFGFQLGILHMRAGRHFDLEVSDLAKTCPNLMKLMGDGGVLHMA